MSKQPEALRLAELLETTPFGSDQDDALTNKAADELRRLHEVNAELVEALLLADALLSGANMDAKAVERKVRNAITKATGEQP